MRYDIVIISHNSENQLHGCIKALERLEYDLSELHVIIVDNGSSADCVRALQQLKETCTHFGELTIYESKKNLGFGRGCNLGVSLGNSPYVFMLNVDTEICPDALTELDKVIEASDSSVGAFELRQKPWETSHHHDPVTMETDWNSSACVVYPRSVYEQVEGFDENIFLYCEDVDISWRIRAYGYKLIYVPKASVFHYTRAAEVSSEKRFREYLWNNYNRMMLHYKFGNLRSCWHGVREYLEAIRYPVHFPHVRKKLVFNFFRQVFDAPTFLMWRKKHRDIFDKVPVNWKDDGYTTMRGIYTYIPLKEEPLVSLIVRACNNADVLRLTLQSLRHQTYRNFEIVLEEDGPDTLSEMLQAEFADLPIRYEATGEKAGRSRAGNRAIDRSRGKYINFLDSDDFLYPEHIELMVATFQKFEDADIVLSGYMRYNTDILRNAAPYEFIRVSMDYMAPSELSLTQLCTTDTIPILSAMFRRELYERKGGLREDIDANEDWAMWLHFFTDPIKVYANPRATCAFVFPNDELAKRKKLDSYAVYHDDVYNDPTLVWHFSAKQLSENATNIKLTKTIDPFTGEPMNS